MEKFLFHPRKCQKKFTWCYWMFLVILCMADTISSVDNMMYSVADTIHSAANVIWDVDFSNWAHKSKSQKIQFPKFLEFTFISSTPEIQIHITGCDACGVQWVAQDQCHTPPYMAKNKFLLNEYLGIFKHFESIFFYFFKSRKWTFSDPPTH